MPKKQWRHQGARVMDAGHPHLGGVLYHWHYWELLVHGGNKKQTRRFIIVSMTKTSPKRTKRRFRPELGTRPPSLFPVIPKLVCPLLSQLQSIKSQSLSPGPLEFLKTPQVITMGWKFENESSNACYLKCGRPTASNTCFIWEFIPTAGSWAKPSLYWIRIRILPKLQVIRIHMEV